MVPILLTVYSMIRLGNNLRFTRKPEGSGEIAVGPPVSQRLPEDEIAPSRLPSHRTAAKHGKPEHEEILVSLVGDPVGSENPNVLRIRAVAALGHLGETEKAVEAIRPYAVSGDWFNGLTSNSVDALAAIGVRAADHHAAVREILIASYSITAFTLSSKVSGRCRGNP